MLNTLHDTDTTIGTAPTLRELRAKARKARSRHPLAKGGRGSRKPGPRKTTIDSLASKIAPQKGLSDVAVIASEAADAVDLTQIDTGICVKSAIPHDTPAHWRATGDVEVVVYARPLNPRMLLVQFDDGSHGRVVMSPREREMFSVKKRLWVRRLQKDVCMLAGRYNRFGVRCA